MSLTLDCDTNSHKCRLVLLLITNHLEFTIKLIPEISRYKIKKLIQFQKVTKFAKITVSNIS